MPLQLEREPADAVIPAGLDDNAGAQSLEPDPEAVPTHLTEL